MAFPDAWEEEALINVCAVGGTSYRLAAATRTIDISGGEKEVEGQPNLAGGRIEKWTPQTDITITFEGWLVDIKAANDTGGWIHQGFETTDDNWDSSQPLSVDASRNREKFNIAILWTDDPTVTTAEGTVSAGYSGKRYVFVNCRLVSVTTAMTDGEVKVTARFKCIPFDKTGNAQYRKQSVDATATLASITLSAASLGGL